MVEAKVVLITGCSSGIGRDLAGRLAARGHRVVATARGMESLEAVKAELRLGLDVTDETSSRRAVEAVLERFGRIDALVNNAGFAIPGTLEDSPEEAMRAMFEVNVFGVARLSRLVAPDMRKQGAGRIVNIGSLAGRWSMAIWGGYSATKFAVEALSDAARQELAGFGVTVSLVEPGPVRTAFAEGADARFGRYISASASPYADLYRRNEILKGRMREPSVDAGAVGAVVVEAIESARPRPRYRVGWPMGTGLMLKAGDRLRDAWFFSAIRKAAI